MRRSIFTIGNGDSSSGPSWNSDDFARLHASAHSNLKARVIADIAAALEQPATNFQVRSLRRAVTQVAQNLEVY
jgi:hypothetical protein